jgi:predicted Zn-dependent protease
MPPVERAAVAARAISAADAQKVQIAGFLTRAGRAEVLRSSTGLSASHRETEAAYTVTARTPDATGSGWAGRELHRAADLDDLALSRTAIDKAVRSARPRQIPPGKYTVILEPQAVAEMLAYLMGSMDLRSVDEGRSYFTGKVGAELFASMVSLQSDPTNPETPGATFDHEGMPLRPQTWIDAGRVKELSVSRFWAAKKGASPTGHHHVFRLGGGRAQGIEELVAGTKRGLLVTRFWYTRMLEPQTVMLTGLTRDGLFLVEDGKVTMPVTNFRYNESPITVLKNVDAMTRSTTRTPSGSGVWHVPALRTHEFTMASPSAAV